jgi:hypothetical protein
MNPLIEPLKQLVWAVKADNLIPAGSQILIDAEKAIAAAECEAGVPLSVEPRRFYGQPKCPSVGPGGERCDRSNGHLGRCRKYFPPTENEPHHYTEWK